MPASFTSYMSASWSVCGAPGVWPHWNRNRFPGMGSLAWLSQACPMKEAHLFFNNMWNQGKIPQNTWAGEVLFKPWRKKKQWFSLLPPVLEMIVSYKGCVYCVSAHLQFCRGQCVDSGSNCPFILHWNYKLDLMHHATNFWNMHSGTSVQRHKQHQRLC